MIAKKQAFFTYHAIRQSYKNKIGVQIPERYELNFLDADTHEVQSMVVSELPAWVKDRKDNGFLLGTLEVDMEVDRFKSDGAFTVYRATYVGFTGIKPVSLG